MIYALDTNIISFYLRKDRNKEVMERFVFEIEEAGNDYVIPPLAFYEISWYLLRKKALVQYQAFRRLYENSFDTAKMAEADFMKAAQIKVSLEEQGHPIDDGDIFIAAYCLSHDYVLVTDNLKHFGAIKDLKCVNWKKG